MQKLRFYYGRNIAIAHYVLMVVCLLSMSRMVMIDFQKPAAHPVAIYFDTALLCTYVLFIGYVFIDFALKNRAKKVALELTENHLVDAGSNRTISWQEIYNLEFEKDKIKVIFNDDNREPVLISMRKIKGDSFDNYSLMYDYMEAVDRRKKQATI